MTGIERLRKLIEDYRAGHECDGFECTELSCGQCMAKNVLEPIADQIERELRVERDRWESDLYEAQVEWNRVTGVCLEMERHCLYDEDTVVRDVARWARELRHAMKSDASDERVKRPAPKVLDADGVEIYKGRIAYGTRGRKYRVTELCEYEPSIVHAQAIDDGELGDEFIAANTGLNSYQLDASKLTHERPDSWERIEEDAEKDPCGYFCFDGEKTCGKCPASGKNCEQTVAQDLVRRARALAERERGE